MRGPPNLDPKPWPWHHMAEGLGIKVMRLRFGSSVRVLGFGFGSSVLGFGSLGLRVGEPNAGFWGSGSRLLQGL